MPQTNPYGLMMTMRRTLYRSGIMKAVKVNAPVISVGNLTVGGTGKTPITKLVVQYLRDQRGKQVGIVMRGYKRETRGHIVVSDGVTNFADTRASGDEAQLYVQELADVIVICDEERARGARKAVDLGAEVIVLDDGYQHLALHRNLNILLIAANEPQGALIPLGRFRESTGAARDADVILITGSQRDDFAKAEAAIASYPLKENVLVTPAEMRMKSLTTLDEKELPLESLRGKKALAVSAIAKPERFHESLSELGATVVPYILPDHSAFDTTIAMDIFDKAAKASCDYIVQTTKDAVKSAPFFRASPLPAYVLEIEYVIADESRFFERIRNSL